MTQAQPPKLILASQSARRAELLQQIGVPFRAIAANIDETPISGEGAADYVLRMAREKAQVIWSSSEQCLPYLGADTAVVLDGDIFGKPCNQAHAVDMLTRMSGRTHQVMTGVALISPQYDPADDQENSSIVYSKISITQVDFRSISLQEINAYWDTGEPSDKAGAYAIQGKGTLFVQELRGSYSGVMGLPLFETSALLSRVGIHCL